MANGNGSLRRQVVGNIREIIFGLEDSLVSTLGTVTGIAVGTQSQYVVILSGLVLIFVEALSMAAGSYLSSKSAGEAEDALLEDEGKTVNADYKAFRNHPIRAALVMGVFYVAGGSIPLVPYFLFDTQDALWPSVVLTAAALFGLGAWSSQFTRRSAARSGVEMMLVSLSAAAIGYVIGRIVQEAFGVNVI